MRSPDSLGGQPFLMGSNKWTDLASTESPSTSFKLMCNAVTVLRKPWRCSDTTRDEIFSVAQDRPDDDDDDEQPGSPSAVCCSGRSRERCKMVEESAFARGRRTHTHNRGGESSGRTVLSERQERA